MKELLLKVLICLLITLLSYLESQACNAHSLPEGEQTGAGATSFQRCAHQIQDNIMELALGAAGFSTHKLLAS